MKQTLGKLCTGRNKRRLIGALMLASFFILLPSFVSAVQNQMAPYTDDEVVITTVSFRSEGMPEGEENVISCLLFQPSPKYSDKKYPAIIACHGWIYGIGKETMNRWCVELAKRGFVVLSIDLPGSGMTIGEMDMFPRSDLEPAIIKDGIQFLKGYSFVNDNHIGLVGISYGATTVALAAGKLGSYVDATFAINGFYSATEWLVEEILPDNDVEFSEHSDYIEIEKIGDKKVTKDNIKEFLKLYGIIRGSEDNMDNLIIDGTNRLDRDFLKKFDALEYLPDVKNNSILFLYSINDKSFGDTGISEQAYDTVKGVNKTAYYVEVDDKHELLDDSEYTSDYIMINFFEEKLMNEDLGDDFDDDFEKYSQERDIELTYSEVFNFSYASYLIGMFLLSLIPFWFILSIIYYNKKIATNRAKKEEEIFNKKKTDKEFIDFTFGRGSYWKTVSLLSCCYIIAYLAIVGGGLGLFSELIIGISCAAFYCLLYLTLYFLPDKAEVEFWQRNKASSLQKGTESKEKISNANGIPLKKKFILLSIIIALVASGIIGLLFAYAPNYYYQPFELIFRSMMAMGVVFLVSAILLALLFERRKNNNVTFWDFSWERYGLDKYSTIRGITFGSAFFLNFFFQWNIWVFYQKFPMAIGPHSFYYIYMALAVVLFYGGFQVLMKIFKENAIKPLILSTQNNPEKNNLPKKILVEVVSTAIGAVLMVFAIYISFYIPLISELFGNFSHLIVLLVVGVYVITNLVKIFSLERSAFGASVFVPLLIFAIVAYVLHI